MSQSYKKSTVDPLTASSPGAARHLAPHVRVGHAGTPWRTSLSDPASDEGPARFEGESSESRDERFVASARVADEDDRLTRDAFDPIGSWGQLMPSHTKGSFHM